MNVLPTVVARDLDTQPEEQRWLIDRLWAEEAVGIVGGEPKCCKSFLALDMAVSVASGASCLGRFGVTRPGRVLLFAAEDALHVVRTRLQGIALARGTELSQLDVHVVTAASVRLDLDDDRKRLQHTVAQLRPRLLVLDPFVRLHRRDENVSGEVAPLLAFLRDLQRRWSVSVVVVHHARKGAGRMRAGQALRGSSEFHAWGDSNLYLRREGTGDRLALTVEHRAAPSLGPIGLVLRYDADDVALEVVDVVADAGGKTTVAPSARERVIAALSSSTEPMSLIDLRAACRMKTRRVSQITAALLADGRVIKTDGGYRLADS